MNIAPAFDIKFGLLFGPFVTDVMESVFKLISHFEISWIK